MIISPRYEQIKNFTIIKRDGRSEPFYLEKLIKVITWACEDIDKPELYIEKLLDELSLKIVDKMKIQDLYDELINIAASKISAIYPRWDNVAKYLFLLKIYKENFNLKRIGTYPSLHKFLNIGMKREIYDKNIIDTFTEDELDEISTYIDPNRDLLFNYKGLRLFFEKYCKSFNGKLKKKKLELPQMTYIAAAIHSHYNEPHSNKLEIKQRLKNIKTTYDLLSTHKISFSTPRISFGLVPRAQFASCVLITAGDDTHSLNLIDGWAALYSKFMGGIAVDFSYVRSRGSMIKANNGLSDGPIPFIKRMEQTVSSFNQSGRRQGSVIIYFPWFHMDVEDLIMLKDAGGAEENRARKCKYSIKINKLLLDRVDKDEYVTLFDPKETSILNELHGKEFEKKYIEFENNANIKSKKIKARKIIELFFKVRVETGNLYVAFMDNINDQEMTGRHIGMSNLCCVAKGTPILTINGYEKIERLAETTVLCWNGYEWSLTPIFRTNSRISCANVQVAIKKANTNMTLDIKELPVTYYHKWLIMKEGKEVRVTTNELIEMLENNEDCITPKYFIPIQKEELRAKSNVNHNMKISRDLIDYIEVEAQIIKITPYPYPVETYCGNEPMNNTLVFNDIMTGNCEITVPSRKPELISEQYYKNQYGKYETHVVRGNGEIGLCNLSSIDSHKWYSLKDSEKDKLVSTLLRGMNNIIETQFYPVSEGAWTNKEYRPIGIGITNFATLVASQKIKYSDDKIYQFMNDLMDDIYYRIYKHSVELSKELGTFQGFRQSNWAKGLTPFHLSRFRKENPLNLKFNEEKWDELGKEISRYGVRFSLHGAVPPSACHPKEEQILTKNGIKSFEEFLINDCRIAKEEINNYELYSVPQKIDIKDKEVELPTRFGNKKVNTIFYNGKKVTRTLYMEDGNKYTFTLDHPILTEDGWKTVGELTENDIVKQIKDFNK